ARRDLWYRRAAHFV
ncbi:hypothetical protein D046_5953B, partial [Vibrio parahaemolyticus V-223/04]